MVAPVMASGRSFTNKEKSEGPKTEPCGTPDRRVQGSDTGLLYGLSSQTAGAFSAFFIASVDGKISQPIERFLAIIAYGTTEQPLVFLLINV